MKHEEFLRQVKERALEREGVGHYEETDRKRSISFDDNEGFGSCIEVNKSELK